MKVFMAKGRAFGMGRLLAGLAMLVMGVVIGGIVVLMYLPIFQVAEQIQ